MDDWDRDPPKRRGLSRLGVTGCASVAFTLGGVLVGLGLITGWIVWHMPQPDMDIGPPPGAFGFLLFLIAAALGVVLFFVWLFVGRPSERAVATVVALTGCAAAVLLVLDAAPWVVKTYADPEVIGVVSATEARPDGVVHVELNGGASLDVRQHSWVMGTATPPAMYQPMDYSSDLQPGNLLLAGNQPAPWYSVATYYPDGSLLRGPDPCYFLEAKSTQRQTGVYLDFGIRLTYAPGHTADSSSSGGDFDEICLDGQGRVKYIVPIR